MKLFGHPIHLMLIHFPSALLPADFVLTVLGYYYNEPLFNYAAFYCLAGGVATGFLAIITGFIDLITISPAKKPAVSAALIHGCINGTLILVYSVLAYKIWKVYPVIPAATITGILIKVMLVLGLFAGNYFGGKLIYHYRIGINNNI